MLPISTERGVAVHLHPSASEGIYGGNMSSLREAGARQTMFSHVPERTRILIR